MKIKEIVICGQRQTQSLVFLVLDPIITYHDGCGKMFIKMFPICRKRKLLFPVLGKRWHFGVIKRPIQTLLDCCLNVHL